MRGRPRGSILMLFCRSITPKGSTKVNKSQRDNYCDDELGSRVCSSLSWEPETSPPPTHLTLLNAAAKFNKTEVCLKRNCMSPSPSILSHLPPPVPPLPSHSRSPLPSHSRSHSHSPPSHPIAERGEDPFGIRLLCSFNQGRSAHLPLCIYPGL